MVYTDKLAIEHTFRTKMYLDEASALNHDPFSS